MMRKIVAMFLLILPNLYATPQPIVAHKTIDTKDVYCKDIVKAFLKSRAQITPQNIANAANSSYDSWEHFFKHCAKKCSRSTLKKAQTLITEENGHRRLNHALSYRLQYVKPFMNRFPKGVYKIIKGYEGGELSQNYGR